MHTVVTVLAQYLIYLLGLVAAVAWLRLPPVPRARLVLPALLAAVVTLALVQLANHVYYDPRPFAAGRVTPWFRHPADNGFPSDHTAIAALAGFLFWPYRRVVAGLLLAGAVLVGTARVLAHVHSPVDIVAAVAFAAAGAAVGHLAGTRLYLRLRPGH